MPNNNEKYVSKPGKPKVIPTFQFHGSVNGKAKYEIIINTIIHWLSKKHPEPIPTSYTVSNFFENNHYGQSISWVALYDPKIWTCRLIHPDVSFDNHSAVAGRNWIIEIVITEKQEYVDVYVKILCSSLKNSTKPFTYTRPRFLIDLKSIGTFIDVTEIQSCPSIVNCEYNYGIFINLLFKSKRVLPVIVLTQADKSKFRVPVSDYILDSKLLAKKLEFSAHVVLMESEYSYRMTKDYGKSWSVFGGAVRIYWPNISLDVSSPYEHDLYLPNNILFWKSDESFSETAFEEHVHNKIFEFNAKRDLNIETLKSFEDAKLLYTQTKINDAKGEADLVPLYEEEIKNLKNKIERLNQDIAESLDIAKELENKKNEYKSDLEKQKILIATLKHHLETSTGRPLKDSIAFKNTYPELHDWITENISDRIELHPRAMHGIKNAQYIDIGLVYKSLHMLAFEYREMRLGNDGAKDVFEAKLRILNIELSKSISNERSGQEGDEYFVEYPPGSMKKKFIKWHLRKGTSRDEKYCLAIYFFWDDEKEKVVVCWLPSHLDNRMT